MQAWEVVAAWATKQLSARYVTAGVACANGRRSIFPPMPVAWAERSSDCRVPLAWDRGVSQAGRHIGRRLIPNLLSATAAARISEPPMARAVSFASQ